MQVSHTTPFKVMPNPGFDLEGREVVTVIAKGTFSLPQHGRAEPLPAAEQSELVMADEYWGEPGSSPVKYESELAPFKPGTDLLLLGNACAADGQPARRFEVEFTVGATSKRRSFFSWSRQDSFPLHAVDWQLKEDKWKGAKHPKEGFGFFPKQVPARARLAGTYDDAWKKERSPFLPADFDYRFFQAAYPDLRCFPYLRGDEVVQVTGLTPGPPLTAALPGLGFEVEALIRKERLKATANLDTLIVEPGRHRLCLLWRTVFQVNGPPSDVKGFVAKTVPLPK